MKAYAIRFYDADSRLYTWTRFGPDIYQAHDSAREVLNREHPGWKHLSTEPTADPREGVTP